MHMIVSRPAVDLFSGHVLSLMYGLGVRIGFLLLHSKVSKEGYYFNLVPNTESPVYADPLLLSYGLQSSGTKVDRSRPPDSSRLGKSCSSTGYSGHPGFESSTSSSFGSHSDAPSRREGF